MYKRIAVATDGSKLSQKAVATALEMAALCNAEVFAIKVTPRLQQSYYEGSVPMNTKEVNRILSTWKVDAENILDKVVVSGKKMGLKVKPIVISSDLVAEAIIKSVDKSNADLLVMASNGRRGIKRILLGSETNNVLTHSKVPVLVVR